MRRAIVGIVLLVSGLAHASPHTEALRLMDEGLKRLDRGDFQAACDLFQRSFELEEDASTVGNLGRCHEGLGHRTRAWQLYRDAATRWENNSKPDLAKKLRDEAARLAKESTTVVIRIPDPDAAGLHVTLNDADVTPAEEIRELVDVREVEVAATADGYQRFERTVTAKKGEVVVVEVAFARAGKTRRDPPPPPPPPITPDPRRVRVRLAIGGLVAAGAAGATALGLALAGNSIYQRSLRDDCGGDLATCPPMKPEGLAKGQHYADVGTYVGIGAGVVAVASLVVYLTAPAPRVVPVATGSTIGVAMRF